MKLIENAIIDNDIDNDGAYYESGGLIEGTPRIPQDHQIKYWQQENCELNLARKFNDDDSHYKCDIKKYKNIDKAVYVGRLSSHIGHFLLESIPKLSEAILLDLPIIGKIEYSKSKNKGARQSNKNVKWLFKTITKHNKFINIEGEKIYKVNKLLIPQRPVILSQSCPEPWKLRTIIENIVLAARKKNSRIKDIDNLYLKRLCETISGKYLDFSISNPNDHISKQIAMISKANKLYGIVGSNTHLCIFARANAETNWIKRGEFIERIRNQAICDLIKTFNEFK